jgi:hypothetical protein
MVSRKNNGSACPTDTVSTRHFHACIIAARQPAVHTPVVCQHAGVVCNSILFEPACPLHQRLLRAQAQQILPLRHCTNPACPSTQYCVTLQHATIHRRSQLIMLTPPSNSHITAHIRLYYLDATHAQHTFCAWSHHHYHSSCQHAYAYARNWSGNGDGTTHKRCVEHGSLSIHPATCWWIDSNGSGCGFEYTLSSCCCCLRSITSFAHLHTTYACTATNICMHMCTPVEPNCSSRHGDGPPPLPTYACICHACKSRTVAAATTTTNICMHMSRLYSRTVATATTATNICLTG